MSPSTRPCDSARLLCWQRFRTRSPRRCRRPPTPDTRCLSRLARPEVAPDGGRRGTLWGFLGVPNHVHFLLLVTNTHRFGKLTPLAFMPPVLWAGDPGSIGCCCLGASSCIEVSAGAGVSSEAYLVIGGNPFLADHGGGGGGSLPYGWGLKVPLCSLPRGTLGGAVLHQGRQVTVCTKTAASSCDVITKSERVPYWPTARHRPTHAQGEG